MDPLQKLLNSLREASTTLNREPLVDADPGPALILVFAAVAILAVSENPYILLAGLTSSMIMLLYARLRRRDLRLAEAIAYPLLVALVASTPLLATGDTLKAMMFVSRVAVSTLFLASYSLVIGWRGMINGLERFTPILAHSLRILVHYIPRFLGQLAKLVAARRARSLGEPSVREWWKMLATSTGELIVKSHQQALMLAYAIEARTLGDYKCGAVKNRGEGVLVLLPAILVLVIGVATTIVPH